MTKRISYIGVLAAVAIVLSFIERSLPPLVPVPGVKLGLANLVVVLALYLLGAKDAFYISAIRIVVVALLFGGVSSFIYSFCGGMLSFLGMVLLKKVDKFTVVGVSIFGGVLHNIGQIIIATIVVENIGLLYYMPVLVFFGIGAGLSMGFISKYTLEHMRVIKKNIK